MTEVGQPNWWTPEHEAAALEGFLSNPIAVAHAEAQAAGAVALQPGAEVVVAGVHLACWWSDRPSVVRVRDASGEWQVVDLGTSPDAHKLTTEWAAIPGTGLEIREVAGPPQFRWHVRPIGVDPR